MAACTVPQRGNSGKETENRGETMRGFCTKRRVSQGFCTGEAEKKAWGKHRLLSAVSDYGKNVKTGIRPALANSRGPMPPGRQISLASWCGMGAETNVAV